jgi:rubrerythrin
MPQTNPFHAVVPRKLTDAELAAAIRLNIEAEMDAINLYAAHIEATDNADAKAVLRHVMDEEREHAALFWQLIRRLDPEQGKHDDEAAEKLRLLLSGASKEEVERAGERGGETPAPAPLDRLSVGPLK